MSLLWITAARPVPSHKDNLLNARLEQSSMVDTGWDTKHFHEMTPEEFGAHRGTMWHGSPAGQGGLERGSDSGIHIGSREAAKQALEARIGVPQKGEWDGTREYGSTCLAGPETQQRLHESGQRQQGFVSGYSTKAPQRDHFPDGSATYSDNTPVPAHTKPDIFPVQIVGEMTNRPYSAHEDFKANGLMAGQIKRGTARRGYFYKNVAEDPGSISAVVPNRAHLATHEDFVRHALSYGHMGRPVPQHNLDRYGLS